MKNTKDINQDKELDLEMKMNKKLRRQNRRLKMFVLFLLFIIFIILGIIIGDYLYSKDYLRIFKLKDELNLSSEVVSNVSEVENKKEEIDIIGEYETKDIDKDTKDSVFISIKINDDYTMSLISYNDNERIENTSGTYIIEDNKLIYNRAYTYAGIDMDEIERYVKIDEKSTFKYSFSNRFSNSISKEEFLIDKDNNALVITDYANLSLNKEKIILSKK